MTIKITGKGQPIKYWTTCTDKKCRVQLSFDEDDIGYNKTYSMGREVDNVEGIVCPSCNQVLHKKDFKLDGSGGY